MTTERKTLNTLKLATHKGNLGGEYRLYYTAQGWGWEGVCESRGADSERWA